MIIIYIHLIFLIQSCTRFLYFKVKDGNILTDITSGASSIAGKVSQIQDPGSLRVD